MPCSNDRPAFAAVSWDASPTHPPTHPPNPPPPAALQVIAHEIRRVVPNPGAPTLAVSSLELEGGTAWLTVEGHPFSGAKQRATVAGLGGRLDGTYAIVTAPPGGSRFAIKLDKKAAEAAEAAMQESVQQGNVTVRCTGRMWSRAGRCQLPARPAGREEGALRQLLNLNTQ